MFELKNRTSNMAELSKEDHLETKDRADSEPNQSCGNNISETNPAKGERKRRSWWPLLVTPYLIGTLWHGLHSKVSVCTGDTRKPRGWYIDENSLDPTHFRMSAQYNPVTRKGMSKTECMCEALEAYTIGEPNSNNHFGSTLSCHQIEEKIEIARIVPLTTAVAPVDQAVVLVVPDSDDWNGGQFHSSIQRMIHRLSSPDSVSWLAKTVLVVTPLRRPGRSTYSLQETVDFFLDSYQGSPHGNATETKAPPVPELAGAMIRNLLVLDFNVTEKGSVVNEFRILPQGRRGVLPNMDLVFLAGRVYSRSKSKKRIPIVMHPYRRLISSAKESSLWTQFLPNRFHSWASGMMDFLMFEYSLLQGPFPPHASALDRGIDALTMEIHLQGKPLDAQTSNLVDVVQKMEYIIRALSNLHERLHHSTSLYLLPSHDTFVKHEEYLIPNLLLLIPLIIRAFTLAVFDIPRFDFTAVGWALAATLVGTTLVAFGLPAVHWIEKFWPAVFTDSGLTSQFVVSLAYLFPGIIILGRSSKNGNSSMAATQSIHFVACLLALYLHVPIAFGHVSLAYPSGLFWTPLVAFPCYGRYSRKPLKALSLFTTALCIALFTTTSPFIYLVPKVFASYTPYVCYVYLPLHLFMTLLWL